MALVEIEEADLADLIHMAVEALEGPLYYADDDSQDEWYATVERAKTALVGGKSTDEA